MESNDFFCRRSYIKDLVEVSRVDTVNINIEIQTHLKAEINPTE